MKATTEKVWISRVDFGNARTGNGVRVFLSDGRELAGVLSVEQRAAMNETQQIRLCAIKGAE